MDDIKKWQEDFRAYISGLNLLRDDYKGIMEYIEEAPTIEPRPRGRWEEKGIAFIRDTNIEKVQEMRCNKCKRWLITPYRRYLTIHKFCPNCGAEMREKA